MQNLLYYDCFSGISGDMNIGALIDLGVDVEHLKIELQKLPISDYDLDIKKESRNGIAGTNFNVIITKEQHHHRTFRSIKEMILGSKLSNMVKNISIGIFKEIAEAEAKVHSSTVDNIHFHEVGAIDSIIDIVGAAISFEYLKIDKVISSSLVLGSGEVSCSHGIIPIPAPATVEILKNIPVKIGEIEFEATTPTGAGIMAYMTDEFSDKPELNISKVGYGIGNKTGKKPNMLRVFLCHEAETDQTVEDATVIESNIDDMNPEHFEFLIEALFEKEALDVYITPIIMKKSRPAFKLTVLGNKSSAADLRFTIFKHSSSIGIREYQVKKHSLSREIRTIDTPFGPVNCKQSYLNNKLLHEKLEYDDCKRLASQYNLSISELKNMIYASKKIRNS